MVTVKVVSDGSSVRERERVCVCVGFVEYEEG